jgi:hypothetical protein
LGFAWIICATLRPEINNKVLRLFPWESWSVFVWKVSGCIHDYVLRYVRCEFRLLVVQLSAYNTSTCCISDVVWHSDISVAINLIFSLNLYVVKCTFLSKSRPPNSISCFTERLSFVSTSSKSTFLFICRGPKLRAIRYWLVELLYINSCKRTHTFCSKIKACYLKLISRCGKADRVGGWVKAI